MITYAKYKIIMVCAFIYLVSTLALGCSCNPDPGPKPSECYRLLNCRWERDYCESEGMSCCDNKKCYSPASSKCCYSGTGASCPKSESCCDGGKSCYNSTTERCCDYGNGKKCLKEQTCCGTNCCARTCNDNWECQKCDNGQCQQCLYKAGSYAELQSCNRVDDPSNEPTANGCGPAEGPEFPDNPGGCVGTSFLGPCNNHDICYGTCNRIKSDCDTYFLDDMYSICSSGSCPPACWAAASAYYTAVEIVGEGAYQSAQLAACACGRCN